MFNNKSEPILASPKLTGNDIGKILAASKGLAVRAGA
jgi:hypothetical protein